VAVADQDQDAGAGVAAAQTDVVQPAVVSQGDDAAEVDAVVAGPGSGRCRSGCRWARLLGGRCRPGWARAARGRGVGSDGVVVATELVEQGLELAEGGRAGLPVEPFLHGLVGTLDFPAGLRVVGPGVAEPDFAGVAGQLEGSPAAAAWGAGEHRPVSDSRPAGSPCSLVAVVNTVLTSPAVNTRRAVLANIAGSGRR
jgi:hypothetical protein